MTILTECQWPPIGSFWRRRDGTLWPMRVSSLRMGKKQEVVLNPEPKMCACRVEPIASFFDKWERLPTPKGYQEPKELTP